MQEELAVSDEFEISESLADAAIRTLKMNLLDQINAHWVIKPEHRLATFLDHGYKHLDLANVDEEIVEFAVSNNFSLEYTKQVIFLNLKLVRFWTLMLSDLLNQGCTTSRLRGAVGSLS